jgi:cytochrome P450
VSAAATIRGLDLLRTIRALRRCYVREQVRLMRAHGDVVALGWPASFLMAFHPDALRRVLADNARNYVKSTNYEELKPVMGEGLVTSEGETWRRSRAAVGPTLSRDALRAFAPHLTAPVQAMLDDWDGRLAGGSATWDVTEDYTRLAFGIAADRFFGPGLGPAHKDLVHAKLRAWERRFVRRVYSIVKLPDAAPTPDALRSRRGIAAVDALVHELIGARGTGDADADDVLGRLLAARALPPRQVRDELMTLLLAGHDTSAAALGWTTWLLARHPRVQDDVYDEARAVPGPPGVDDVERLPLLRRVIDESLRLYPPVPGFSRAAIDDDVVGGVPVRAGTKIELSVYATHRHPAYWPDAERFDPDRFDGRPVDPYAYLPFSRGPRTCIGKAMAELQLLLTLAAVVRRVRFATTTDAEPEPFAAITLRPRDGLPLVVSRR